MASECYGYIYHFYDAHIQNISQHDVWQKLSSLVERIKQE